MSSTSIHRRARLAVARPLLLLLVLQFPLLQSVASAHLCPQATSPSASSTASAAATVLASNWVPSINSTLPSPNLYPHQWSWDAAFVAMGYSHYHTARAVAEVEALFRAQWANGLLPHIVFNPATDESYFPGPSFWRTHTSPAAPPSSVPTSGIVQPPVHAIASLAIFRNARTSPDKAAARAHLERVFPKLVLWHDYLYNLRDPLNEGLVFIRHMWESGMDNSPAWDAALEAIHLTPDMIPEYTRVDKGKVKSHNERPTSFFYDRAVYLIKLFYDNAYDETAIFEHSPFLVQDVLFNAILAHAGEALADIADILGKPDDAAVSRQRSAKTAAAITDKLYDPVDKFFYDYDMVAKRLVRNKISGGLVALYGAKVDAEHVSDAVDHLLSSGFLGKDLSAWTIPSVSKHDPLYTNTTYWKGPAWLNINYLVRDGLVRNAGDNKDAVRIARYLRDRSIEMVNRQGFYEYFNPISGSPHGGHQFSWSAALTIDWLCSGADEVDGQQAVQEQLPLQANMVMYSTVLLGLVALFARALASATSDGMSVDEALDEAEPGTDAAEKKSAAAKRGDARVLQRAVSSQLRARTRGAGYRRAS